MNKIKANAQPTVPATGRTHQQRPAAVVETLLESYPEIAESIEEAFDIIDEASWGSFPASDAPGWIPTQIGSYSFSEKESVRQPAPPPLPDSGRLP